LKKYGSGKKQKKKDGRETFMIRRCQKLFKWPINRTWLSREKKEDATGKRLGIKENVRDKKQVMGEKRRDEFGKPGTKRGLYAQSRGTGGVKEREKMVHWNKSMGGPLWRKTPGASTGVG